MARARGERRFYKPLCRWLVRRGYYCGQQTSTYWGKIKWFTDRGTKAQRVDVAGVRSIGTNCADEMEIVAVEVRSKGLIRTRDLSDAQDFRQFAHLAYLAAPVKFPDRVVRAAEERKVGLIQISRGKRPRFEEALRAPKMEPESRTRMLEFLKSLEVFQCTLCQCFFPIWTRLNVEIPRSGKSFSELKRTKLSSILNKRLDPFEIVDKGLIVGSDLRISRYICPLCAADLTRILQKQLRLPVPHKVKA